MHIHWADIHAQAESKSEIAKRHTDQSWHQRFKSNQTSFKHRINRFIEAKIDRKTLKTPDEMKAEEEKRERFERREAEQAARLAEEGANGEGQLAGQAVELQSTR